LKYVEVIKAQERWKNCFWVEKVEATWQPNTTRNPGLNPFAGKDARGTTVRTGVGPEDQRRVTQEEAPVWGHPHSSVWKSGGSWSATYFKWFGKQKFFVLSLQLFCEFVVQSKINK
jgi:hypothetical protein